MSNIDINIVKKTIATLQQSRANLQERFKKKATGQSLVQNLSADIDVLLKELFAEFPVLDQVDVIAVGGYGRAELSPHSDWDLWFLVPKLGQKAMNESIEKVLYVLWDLNIKLGYAVRTVDESMTHIQEDWQSATAALDMRLLHGSAQQFDVLNHKLDRFFQKKKKLFVQAKLDECLERRQRMGATAYMMEPNIKEGEGGLRDIHTIFWMMKVWYGKSCIEDLIHAGILTESEWLFLERAQQFLWRCRCGLHLQIRRASDQLYFDMQYLLSEEFSYQDNDTHRAVEQFMRDYFSYVGRVAHLTDMFIAHFKELLYPQRFVLKRNVGDAYVQRGNLIDVTHDKVFSEKPLRLLEVFHIAQEGKRHLSSNVLRLVYDDRLLLKTYAQTSEASQLLLKILKHSRNVAWTLRKMHQCGVLGIMIPDFGRVEGLGQFSCYHVYSVDEHTIRAVAQARNIRRAGPDTEKLTLSCKLMPMIKRPSLLYLALLFHDLGKGLGGKHEEKGAVMATNFCRQLGLNEDDIQLVSWLVLHHLDMATISQRCDLTDPEVIENFAQVVGHVERLQYLLLLTVTDIHAVGPNVWNDWKGALLRDLYHATERHLLGQVDDSDTIKERAQVRIESTLAIVDVQERASITPVLSLLSWRAILHYPPKQLLKIAELVAKSDGKTIIDFQEDVLRGDTRVMIISQDRQGLFADLTAVIATSHINVLAAQIYHLGDGRCLDIFHIQQASGELLSDLSTQTRLHRRIEAILAGKKRKKIHLRYKKTVLMQKVYVTVEHLSMGSSQQSVLQVEAADRIGLLAALSAVIDDAGYDLCGAAILSFGEKSIDVFFLRQMNGESLTEVQIKALSQQLYDVAQLSKD
ncbi:MAG: [protein-PII] uridylyltransferase [Mariprofundaceae bacterium]|nr:[protein-PII] uridylyltransferase [Mariprofundaceae bacterium]